MLKLKFPVRIIFFAIAVAIFVILSGNIYLLFQRIIKLDNSKFAELSGKEKLNTSRLMNCSQKLSACQKEAAGLKKIIESDKQVLSDSEATKADLLKQKEQLEAKIRILQQEKSKMQPSVTPAPEKAKPVVLEQPVAKVVKENNNNELAKQKAASKLAIESLEKKNKEAAEENSKLKLLNNSRQNDIRELKNLNVQLEKKAAEFLQRASNKEELEQQAVQLNKVIAVLSRERSALDNKLNRTEQELQKIKSERADTYLMAANAYMQSGLYDSAIEDYNKLLELEPNNAQAHLRLGFLYKRARDNPSKAVNHFKQYLRLEPNAKNRKEIEYLIQMLSE